MWMSEDRVPSMNIESPYGGGVSSLPGATGSLLPVKFPVGFLAGCSCAGRRDPCGGCFRTGVSPC